MNFLLHHTTAKYFMEGLWRDEAFSWAMASRGLDLLPLTARDFNPPLYYLLLYGWMSMFGTSEHAMRSLSLLFYAGTLWIVWRFMRDLVDVPAPRAVLYMALFALNPVLSYFAVEARMYSMLAFCAAGSFYAYVARKPGVYVLSTTAGLFTHYFMILVVLTQLLSAFLERDGRAPLRRRVFLLGVPLLLFAPWLAITLSSRGGVGFWTDPPGWRFGMHLVTSIYTGHDATYGFLDRPERWAYAAILIPLVAWALRAVLGATREKRSVLILVALWALVPPVLVFAATLLKPVFVPRYLIFSTVGLVLLLVAGIERARPRARVVSMAVLCALAVHYQALQAQRHSKGQYRETVNAIREQAGPQDVLYVRNELDFFPAQYYFDPDRVFIYGRRLEQIPPYVGKVLIPESVVVREMAAPPVRVFMLKNHGEFVKVAAPAWTGAVRTPRHAYGR